MFLLLLNGCQAIKINKLMRSGEVDHDQFNITIPFELRAGVPMVQAEVNGMKGWFLFDSGAPNVISAEFAAKLKLKQKASAGVRDSGGNFKSSQTYVNLEDINIGGVHFRNTGAIVQDLRSSDIFKCLDFDGIIGANLMRQAVWKLDYAKNTISFSDDIANMKPDSSYQAVPFSTLLSGTPVVTLELSGIPVPGLLFDTGSNKSFSLPLRSLRQLKDSLPAETTWELGATSYGVGGKGLADTIFYTTVDTLQLGGHRLTQIVVAFDEHAYTIGNEFFQHYDVILDWNSRKIYLREVTAYANDALVTHGFGVDLVEGGLQVGSIYHGSQAEGQLQIGDQILQIDEFRFDPEPDGLICELVNSREIKLRDRESIDIKVKRGEETLDFNLDQLQLLPINQKLKP